jgi:hypothetical protein
MTSSQFEILIRDSKDDSIEQVIENLLMSDIYLVSKFLDFPKVQKLGEKNKYFQTLKLFSYLTYLDYKKAKANYIDLKPKMLQKLKILSILEIAKFNKIINYDYLKSTLDIKDNFELEEILFETISSGLVVGYVNSMKQCVNVVSVKSRNNLMDLKKAEITIDKWINNINYANTFIENQEKDLNNKNNELKIMLTN